MINFEMPKAVKKADEHILKQYTKVAKKWEDKNRDIYHLSLAVNLTAKYLIIQHGDDVIGHDFGGWLIDVALYNWDTAYTLSNLLGPENETEVDGVRIYSNPIMEFYKKINQTVRLPTLVTGLGLVGKSVYEIGDHFITGAPYSATVFNELAFGMGLIGMASSQYIKERDPKLLEKKPLLQEAKDRMSKFVTKIMPEKTPSFTYNSIDSIL